MAFAVYSSVLDAKAIRESFSLQLSLIIKPGDANYRGRERREKHLRH